MGIGRMYMIDQRVIRVNEIASTKEKQGKLPVSKGTVWRWVKEGRFPKPFKLSERVTVFSTLEVENFISTKWGKK